MVVSDRRLGRGRQHREEEMWEKRGMFGHSKVEFVVGSVRIAELDLKAVS
jgi:hypothetical protein